MPEKSTLFGDVANALRGLMMGAADIVPGVSGGTVALLLGIYPRLLTAISHVDGQLFSLVRQGKWRQAAEHLDLRFLLSLVIGIGTSVLLLSGLLHYLLENHRELTMSVFFGLILASGILVLRMVGPNTPAEIRLCIAMAIAGAGLAGGLVLYGFLQPHAGLPYTFLCGAIAICAMILPGISGSYLLVLLGKYQEILGILHDLKSGAATNEQLLTLAVFAVGCLVGLLVFSKVLKALLASYYIATMSLLGGFMLGSLVKIWPWQESMSGAPEEITRPAYPPAWDQQVLYCLLLGVAAFAFVLIADQLARLRAEKRAEGSADQQ